MLLHHSWLEVALSIKWEEKALNIGWEMRMSRAIKLNTADMFHIGFQVKPRTPRWFFFSRLHDLVQSCTGLYSNKYIVFNTSSSAQLPINIRILQSFSLGSFLLTASLGLGKSNGHILMAEMKVEQSKEPAGAWYICDGLTLSEEMTSEVKKVPTKLLMHYRLAWFAPGRSND